MPTRVVALLALEPANTIKVWGFGDKPSETPTYLVNVQVHDLKPVPVEVISHPDEVNVLLGRDVLNQFVIRLDGPALKLEILA